MKLSITLANSRSHYDETIDSPAEVKMFWTSEMDDCSVHAWFKVFESVLAAAGYNEKLIMRGACELAFNDSRLPEDMKQLSKEYELDFKND